MGQHAVMSRFTPPPSGSIAVVTGASSGIGQGLARALALRGHPVLAVARRAERLQALARDAATAGASPIHPLPLDLTAAGAAATIRDRAAALGPLGWVVNNAGSGTFGRFEGTDVDAERATLHLNCEAPLVLTRALLPALVAQRAGIVLNVASCAAFQPTPGWSVYGASKAFLLSWSEALHEELRGSGVSVTALCPGPTSTEIFGAHPDAAQRKPPPYELSVEEVVERGIAGALRGRAVVITGKMNRIMTLASKLAPRGMVRQISGRTSLTYIGFPPLPPRDR